MSNPLFKRHVFGNNPTAVFDIDLEKLIEVLSIEGVSKDIELPWVAGVKFLNTHILNKLIRSGFDLNEAFSLINKSHTRYDSTIDKFINEIIEESPDKSIGLSTTKLRTFEVEHNENIAKVVKVKTDITDRSIGFSMLCLRNKDRW